MSNSKYINHLPLLILLFLVGKTQDKRQCLFVYAFLSEHLMIGLFIYMQQNNLINKQLHTFIVEETQQFVEDSQLTGRKLTTQSRRYPTESRKNTTYSRRNTTRSEIYNLRSEKHNIQFKPGFGRRFTTLVEDLQVTVEETQLPVEHLQLLVEETQHYIFLTNNLQHKN